MLHDTLALQVTHIYDIRGWPGLDTSFIPASTAHERWALAGAHRICARWVWADDLNLLMVEGRVAHSRRAIVAAGLVGGPGAARGATQARTARGAQWGECACVGRRAESCGLKGSRLSTSAPRDLCTSERRCSLSLAASSRRRCSAWLGLGLGFGLGFGFGFGFGFGLGFRSGLGSGSGLGLGLG